jgi:SAM-dependent methyltransferase
MTMDPVRRPDPTSETSPVALACPRCHARLESVGSEAVRCPADGTHYERKDGIWRFLLAESAERFERFTRDYENVRSREGRGSADPAYYRGLPFRDLTGRLAADWALRARGFSFFLDRLIRPLETGHPDGMVVLDLGAGNGWLSYRLALRGHRLAAVDLLVNPEDGLGAWRHYDAAFTPIQAEFDRLPIAEEQADLAVFNASIHYATDIAGALREALRVLRPDGSLVILDTPIYSDARSGQAMVKEREAQFERLYGFPSNALRSENFLTYERIAVLARALDVEWTLLFPDRGLRWRLRPIQARLLRRREPAELPLIVGRRRSAGNGR